MKYDFTIHSMQPSIHLLFGFNNLKIRNINVEVVNNLVVLTLDGSATISNHWQSFSSNNTLTSNTMEKPDAARLISQPRMTTSGHTARTITAPSCFAGFSKKEMNSISMWIYNILMTAKTDSLTA